MVISSHKPNLLTLFFSSKSLHFFITFIQDRSSFLYTNTHVLDSSSLQQFDDSGSSLSRSNFLRRVRGVERDGERCCRRGGGQWALVGLWLQTKGGRGPPGEGDRMPVVWRMPPFTTMASHLRPCRTWDPWGPEMSQAPDRRKEWIVKKAVNWKTHVV